MDKLLNKSLLLKSIYSKQIKITNPNYISVKIVLRQLVDVEQLRCQVQLVEEGQRKHGKK